MNTHTHTFCGTYNIYMYIPSKSSTKAIMRWRSGSVPWTWYCRRICTCLPPDPDILLTIWQVVGPNLTIKVRRRDPVHFHEPRSSARTSLGFESEFRLITNETLCSTETGWVVLSSSSVKIGSSRMCTISSQLYPRLGWPYTGRLIFRW